MPATVDGGPAVALSFANNFWGKDDAGVPPMLERMSNAKHTSDELRSFYAARASIEEDYARKLMSLCRKSLGSQESGTLKTSMDTVRGEVESMAKQHASIAVQMKTELEEPLGAFAAGLKERRKIIQNTIEKLLKIKVQQTSTVNKTRDRYEQECLKIKGYLAQGHMVMGQEERKNKAKLEKTQISVATTNTEYEAAVKILEDTTVRWNREWKAAADKFQDLEEERLDFTKSSLWAFANIASTVCVSDDSSCEKIRLSLENMDVEKDIVHFITEKGTGQEIPDAPKYINFCRGDVDDYQSEIADDDNYSVAQFPRSINPAYRSSSPQPSTFESHHDPNSQLARELGHMDISAPSGREIPKLSQKPQAAIAAPPVSAPSINTQSMVAPSMPSPSAMQPPAIQAPPMQSHSMQTYSMHAASVPAPLAAPMHPPEDRRQQQRQLEQRQQEQRQQEQRQQEQQQLERRQLEQRQQEQQQLERRQLEQRQQEQRQQEQRQQEQRQQEQRQQEQRQQEQRQLEQRQLEQRQQEQHRTRTYEAPPSRRLGPAPQQFDSSQYASVPHDPYPQDGMTMLCRTDGMNSATSSNLSSNRPSSRDDNSEYSNPTSFSSQEPPSGPVSPVKQEPEPAAQLDKRALKKRSGFFQNHSPFRRKSTKEAPAPSNRNTWGPSSANTTPRRQQPPPKEEPQTVAAAERTATPEPIEANASLALNIGQNVFPVTNSDKRSAQSAEPSPAAKESQDPIALALAELKGASGGTKHAANRVSADRYAGIATPAPDKAQAFSRSVPPPRNNSDTASVRGAPAPSSYSKPTTRLGVPPPAVTAKAMEASSRKYTQQTRDMFNKNRPKSEVFTSAPSRPTTRGSEVPRATSPAPPRNPSPRPSTHAESRPQTAHRSASPNPYGGSQYGGSQYGGSQRGSASPNPYGASQHRNSTSSQMGSGASQAGSASRRTPNQGYYNDAARSASPAASYRSDYNSRPLSRAGGDNMSVQLAPSDDGGSMRGRGGGRPGTSHSSRGGQLSFWDGRDPMAEGSRQRSQSVADPSRQYTPDGRPILHYARALYMYQAAIPEELGFNKGDTLAVLRHQDDGWWEAEIHAGNAVGMNGLVPSNYLQPL